MVPRPRTDSEDRKVDGQIFTETSGGLRYRPKNESEISSTSRSKSMSQSAAKRSHSYGLGKLRFRKAHGMLGLFSLSLVPCALYMVHTTPDIHQCDSTTLLAVTLAILSTTALAVSAIPLLKQVPKCTVISKRWNVIPPHKEAFRRTIAIVGYLDLRLTNELLKVGMMSILSQGGQQHLMSSASQENWQWWFSKALSIYHLWFFLPRGSFDNGNTWVFVVPMFLGFGVDIYHQDPSTGIPWNENVVTVEYLLLTLLAAQIVAFMFTLGFRNIVPIRYGYWIAALVVFLLCAGMRFNYNKHINPRPSSAY